MKATVIAIIGRPNVGKSTLFNRLIGVRKTVVSSTRGTTRDRIYGRVEWRGLPFTLIDTGGFDFAAAGGLAMAVQQQVQQALHEADACLLVCDAQEGLLPADEMILERLRPFGKPVILAINKMDHRLVVPPEFFSLGITPPFPVSAMHGRGTGELLDHLVKEFVRPRSAHGPSEVSSPRPAVAMAIIGRQNVGKSSLLNAFLREERVIVSAMPGTTRDAVDTPLTVDGQPILLIDTAGLRHRRKVRHPVDLFSMSRTLEAIERCDVALLVLDGTQGVTRDDQRIVAKVCDVGRGLMLLVNKWDLVRGGNEQKLRDAIRRALPFASFAPVLAISAKTGFQVPRALTATLQLIRSMQRGLSEEECTRLMQHAWAAHPPPRFRGRVIRLKQARWLADRPPRLELITSPIGRLPTPYHRHLLKSLHAHPRLAGIPVTLVVKDPPK